MIVTLWYGNMNHLVNIQLALCMQLLILDVLPPFIYLLFGILLYLLEFIFSYGFYLTTTHD
jgi:hypothetical protein